jgi:hypothetical protein
MSESFLEEQMNSALPKVLLDTSALKFSANFKRRIVPVNRKIRNSRGELVGMIPSEIQIVDDHERIAGDELRKEAQLLRRIAEAAKDKKLRLFIEQESQIEGMGLPKMDRVTGTFYEAPTERAASPFPYTRAVFAARHDAKNLALDFFKSISDERFKTLQKITGAYQGRDAATGAERYNLNQLRDAFYIWCAEHNDCDYLLALDFKLVKMVRECRAHRTAVKVVKPSELLAELGIAAE